MYVDTCKALIGHKVALYYIGPKRPYEIDDNEAVPLEIDDTGAFFIENLYEFKSTDTCHIMIPGKVCRFNPLISIGIKYMRKAG